LSGRSAPAALRNRDAIAAVLRESLPVSGLILEVASGTGEHALHFARLFPGLEWQPSDPDSEARASILAWCESAGLPNLRRPVALDAASDRWPVERADALLCINMVHISAWRETEGLMRGAGRVLREAGAPLILYGPYRREGVETAPSNEAFDASLRSRNPQWGLRDVEAVAGEAERHGLRLDKLIEMPANNLTLIFRRVNQATTPDQVRGDNPGPGARPSFR
jgi:SAM-dependent methyltransferase